MTDQEEFEKWLLEFRRSKRAKGFSFCDPTVIDTWQACAERKNAIIEQQAKELEALRGFCSWIAKNQFHLIYQRIIIAKKYGIIDENENPTKLLTGEK